MPPCNPFDSNLTRNEAFGTPSRCTACGYAFRYCAIRLTAHFAPAHGLLSQYSSIDGPLKNTFEARITSGESGLSDDNGVLRSWPPTVVDPSVHTSGCRTRPCKH
eukprot:5117511-Amphidinium_carterae.1